MLHRILKGLYHFTVYAVGICVLLAAISVTVVRLLLPDIGMYRGEIEAWVSQYMGYPVAVRSLDASWEGWIPRLHLRDIDLLNREGTQAITHFNSAQISIAPLATLLQRQFVPRHLQISGFELSVVRRHNGSIYIQGIPLEERSYTDSRDNELAEWLFRQNRIEIQNGHIEWVDAGHQQAPILLKDVHLLLRTDGNRLQMEGSARLPDTYGRKMDFAFDAYGDLMTSNWSGELYLEGKNINPDNWYRDYRPFEFNVAGGAADIKVWSNWDRARLDRIQGQLQYTDFTASVGNNRLRVRDLDYDFLGERIDNQNWRFSINLNDFVTENGAWPDAGLALNVTPLPDDSGSIYSAEFSYLKLGDLVPLLAEFSFLPDKTRDAIEQLNLKGNLVDGEIRYNTGEQSETRLSYDIRFEDFGTYAEDGPLQVKSLSGHAVGNLDGGTIAFNGDTAEVLVPSIREGILPVSRIDGALNWQKSGNKTTLQTPLLTLANQDIAIRLAGTAVFGGAGSPYLDTVAELAHVDLDKLATYIPYTPRFKMRDWMDKSVLGGDLISASALLRGNLADFPFRHREGQFKLIANVENGVLEYSDQWPVVDNLNTEIDIDAMRLSARINQGQIYDAAFSEGRVTIPDLFQKGKNIFVDGRIAASINDLKIFMAHSPMVKEASLKEVQKALSGGSVNLELDMKIPWKIPEAKPEINGHVELREVGLISHLSNIELNGISGNLHFDRSSVSGSGLSAVYKDIPVTLSVDGSSRGKESNTTITLNGQADKSFIADQIQNYLTGSQPGRQFILDRISGNTDWTATLRYYKPADSENLHRYLTLESDLAGINLALPSPLGKKAGSERFLKIQRRLDDAVPPRIEARYDNILSAEFMLSPSDRRSLQRADIHFGPGKASSMTDGIMISGRIDSLSLNEWWNFLQGLGNDKQSSSGLSLRTNLNIANLHMLSQHFTDVTLDIRQSPNTWQISADSETISGDISLPVPLKRNNLVTIDLDKLHLQHIDKIQHSRLDPHKLPSITANIDEFSYGNTELGALELSASPSEEGMVFNTITFTKPGLSIHGEGNWASDSNGDQSSFAIEVHAEKIDHMLKTFGYDVTTFKNGETNLLINADWEGTPIQFSLEKLNGNISMKISDGQLLNVEPSAGRLFGLLSVQALPRRLTLDFRDLFSQGLAFDVIEGNFNVTNGNAYTNDLFMSGPSADVAISGRTGLSEKDYDQRVTVTPQVAESLPVAGAIFGPVGIGVGAIFYLAGEMFESLRTNIDSILRYQYTITGSWEDPVVEKINPAREASG